LLSGLEEKRGGEEKHFEIQMREGKKRISSAVFESKNMKEGADQLMSRWRKKHVPIQMEKESHAAGIRG